MSVLEKALTKLMELELAERVETVELCRLLLSKRTLRFMYGTGSTTPPKSRCSTMESKSAGFAMPELNEEEKKWMRAGNKIMAIKCYRSRTGLTLVEAKRQCEAYEAFWREEIHTGTEMRKRWEEMEAKGLSY